MKAADISDQEIFDLVNHGQTSLYTLQTFFHATRQIPPKVVHAKLAQMIYKGRLLGCHCGCRGDFEIPATVEAGRLERKQRLQRKKVLQCSK